MEQMAELEACRICVTCYSLKDMDFIYIFQKNEEFQQELDFIQGEIKQWQLSICPEDGLPQRICANCFAKFCSIDAFRRECEQAQEKLAQTVQRAKEQLLSPAKSEQQPLLTQTDTPLPLVGGNYATTASNAMESDQQDLMASSNMGLNDFPVFDQQFQHYDNPALMDSSATLFDNNLMAGGAAHDLGDFLPSQNLFAFETAEPPSAGTTLPLDETEIPSIMGGIIEVAATTDEASIETNLIKQDLEDMLQRSMLTSNLTSIANGDDHANADTNTTNTHTLTTAATQRASPRDELNLNNTPQTKTEVKQIMHIKKNTNTQPSSAGNKVNSVPRPLRAANHDNASDNECDETHVNGRIKDLPFTCHYCYCPEAGPIAHLSFPDDDTLSQHFFDQHDPNRPYNCPQCQYSYKTKKLRDNHVKIAHEQKAPQKCNYCQKVLKGAVEIHQYNCQHVGDWECEHCPEKFPNSPLYRFRLHQRQHDQKNFKCQLCDRTFLRKSNLDAHERMHKSGSKTQWQCSQCNINFNTDQDLRRHKTQYHSDCSKTPIKCKDCNQAFVSFAFLQRHIIQIHGKNLVASTESNDSNDQQHVCSKCNLAFANDKGLQCHLQAANVNNGQCLPPNSYNFKERRRIQRQGVFPCFLCPKRFHLRSQLDKHLNTHDARLRPHQCGQCYVRCRTAIELKHHVNMTHLNIRTFSCEKCGKSFGFKRDLRDHMMFHGDINVRCTEEGCDYACKNEKALADHIRHKHRLLPCEYCHQEFTRQKLTSHLRNAHRAEIDVELADESDNYYKSKFLNNNNDIKQTSFNLLNNTQNANATSALNSAASSPMSTCGTYDSGIQTLNSALMSSSASSSTLSSAAISPSANHHLHASLSQNNNPHTTPSLQVSINENHVSMKLDLKEPLTSAQQQLQQHPQPQPQPQQSDAMSPIFVTDHNSNNLAINGFVTASNELNYLSNAEANVFIGTPGSSNISDISPNLDQYFMASLMDTEQEIIVS